MSVRTTPKSTGSKMNYGSNARVKESKAKPFSKGGKKK